MRAERQQRPPLFDHLRLARRRARVEKSRSLGEVRRDEFDAGEKLLRRFGEAGAGEGVAGGGDHHRVIDPRPRAFEGGGDRLRGRRRRQHADLDRRDVEILAHRGDLRRDEIRRRAAGPARTPSVFCAVIAVIAQVP